METDEHLVTCGRCRAMYDPTTQWTFCPHDVRPVGATQCGPVFTGNFAAPSVGGVFAAANAMRLIRGRVRIFN